MVGVVVTSQSKKFDVRSCRFLLCVGNDIKSSADGAHLRKILVLAMDFRMIYGQGMLILYDASAIRTM